MFTTIEFPNFIGVTMLGQLQIPKNIFYFSDWSMIKKKIGLIQSKIKYLQQMKQIKFDITNVHFLIKMITTIQTVA